MSNEWLVWRKIGEIKKGASVFTRGSTEKYVVMERINRVTGMRQYKEVLVATYDSEEMLYPQDNIDEQVAKAL